MRIDKAIERNQKLISSGALHLDPETQASVELGIEAFRYTLDVRIRQSAERRKRLPGETEE